jgi:UDP-N-acetylmuramoyl-tripeptide--D-alanyl-D-alanine ligase
MKWTLREVAGALGLAPEQGGQAAAWDATVSGWSVDSRTLVPGDLFFALRGPNHDGREYAMEALRKGAVAAVVEKHTSALERNSKIDASPGGIVLRVENSLCALQTLAAKARQRWGGEVVAVTGSAGKTTAKNIIAEMLSERFATARSEGNLNNHIGLPLSLLRMEETAQAAVLEIGMNHGGEIRALAAIARPQVGVLTNVGYAHIENFDSIEDVAAAKRELIEALPSNGTAVLNADDPRVVTFSKAHQGRTILYGQSSAAEVRAEDVDYAAEGVRFRVGSARFATALNGRHSVSNILAGIAVAGLYGIPPEQLRERVRKLVPTTMRGERFYHQEVLIYNDCYNSNPDAARAMLDVLRDTPAQKRIAVLGEMLELGRWAEPLHRDVGSYAVAQGIDVLVGIRGAACYMLDAARQGGLRTGAAFFFHDPSEAGRLVRTIAQPGDAVLFKGSRGIHVERALEQFLATPPQSPGAGARS